MSKKAKQLVAGTLGLLLVGGTFAWFTSSDSITNKFSTVGGADGDANAGIQVCEDIDGKNGNHDDADLGTIIPGDSKKKEVKLESTVNYDQIVRAKIVKEFTDKDGNVITHYDKDNNGKYTYSTSGPDTNKLNTELIQIEGINTADWTFVQTDNYYYYKKAVVKGTTTKHTSGTTNTENHSTTNLFTKVKLSTEADNVYRDLSFRVVIDGEGIQATNGAVNDWQNAPDDVKKLDPSNNTAPTN